MVDNVLQEPWLNLRRAIDSEIAWLYSKTGQFTPGSVEIVMESPEQSRPGRHFDGAVQAEADQKQ